MRSTLRMYLIGGTAIAACGLAWAQPATAPPPPPAVAAPIPPPGGSDRAIITAPTTYPAADGIFVALQAAAAGS